MVSTAMHDLHPSSYVPEQPDTFRQIMAPLPTVKIDVEGSDLQMMRGARRVLSQRPIIDLELHCSLFENRNDVIAEIFSILEPLNYAYSVLPRPDGAVLATHGNINLTELAQYQNPHVFCLPMW